MNQPLVSIIVPVYNVGSYLGPCLESIQAQTYPNLEVLLVNDGSTDGSAVLCKGVVRADRRFHLIDQANAGVSAARNTALSLVTGKYIQFVDGDDQLSPQAVETLVHSAETTGADLVIAHFIRVDGERQARQGHIRGRRLLTRQEFAQEMVKAPANYYYGVLWNKLYRRNIVTGHSLSFAPEVSWGEDFLFNLEYIRHVRLVSAVPEAIYFYCKRKGSLVTSSASLRRLIQMKRTTFDYYKDLYQDLDLYDEQKARVYCYLIASATDGLAMPRPERPQREGGRWSFPSPDRSGGERPKERLLE